MGGKKRSQGPPGGLVPGSGRQKARSREVLSRAWKRAEPPAAQGPEIAVSRVGLLETQPRALMAYWEAEPRALSAARGRTGDPEAGLVLRFRDVSLASKEHGQESFDIRVEGLQGSRFVGLEKPFRLVRCELGVLGADGRFSALARSNVAQMPRDRESERYEESFRRLNEGPPPSPPPGEHPRHNPGNPGSRKLPPMQEDIQRVYGEFPPRIPRELPPSNFPPAPPPGRASARNSSAIKPPPPIVPAPPPKGNPQGPTKMGNPGHTPATGSNPGPPGNHAGPEAYLELEWGFWQPDVSEEGVHGGKTAFGDVVTLSPGKEPGPGPGPGPGSGPEGSRGTTPSPESFGGASAAPRRPGDGLDLEVHVDVVIYGRTQPGTQVHLSGTELTAKDDGTFEARFALPSSQGPGPREGMDRSMGQDR